jgi:hypothetical protein
MLNAHPRISAPHPPHILSNFHPIINCYGNLHKQKHFTQLATDICEFVKLNRVPWISGTPTAAELISYCSKPDLFLLFEALHRFKAGTESKDHYVNKSMGDFRFATEMEKRELPLFYIHLVRDGRANAASFLKSPIGDKHPYILGKKWAEDQLSCLNLEQFIPKNRFLRIWFEDLVAQPENTLHYICKKTCLPFDEAMIHYNESAEARTAADAGPLWKNLVQKPLSEKINVQNLLDEHQTFYFEQAASEALIKMGYPVQYKASELNSSLDLIAIESENKLLKEQWRVMDSISSGQADLIAFRRKHPL